MSPAIKVGVFAWCRFPRRGEFYPSDLPPEWRLGYYSNEFDSACVEVECFHQSTDALLESVEDLRQDFELSFSAHSPADVSLLADLMPMLDFPVRYLVADPSNSDILLPVAEFESLLSSSADSASGQVVEVSGLWRPEPGSPGDAPVALLPGAATARQYRDWIEQWLSGGPRGQQLTLWLDSRTADYQSLQICRSVVELMGH